MAFEMTKKSRRTFFYILGFAFMVTAPLIVAYSVGYTFDFGTREIEKTGGIFIHSDTPRLSLFLDGELKQETSFLSGSSYINGIHPGIHLFRAEKEGYHAWSRSVNVEQEVVTEFRNVLLVPDPLPVATSSEREITALRTSTTTPELAVLGKKNLLTLKSGETLLRNVLFFKTLKGKVFAVTDKGFLAEIDPDSKEVKTIGSPGFYISKIPFKFIAAPGGDILLIDSSGGVFLLHDGAVAPLDGAVSNAVFDRTGGRLMLQKERELEVIWISPNPRQPFQKKGAKERIVEAGEIISDALWFGKNDLHVIFASREGLYLTELDGRGGRYAVELVSGKVDEVFVPEAENNQVFFKKGKIWYKIEL